MGCKGRGMEPKGKGQIKDFRAFDPSSWFGNICPKVQLLE
jgi:hypothetical protein